MKSRRLLLNLVATAGALTASPAIGCSVAAEYRVPTNLELATQADAIVVGQVVGGTASDAGAGSVTVRPIAALKGLMPGQDFLLHGMALASGQAAQPSAPSDPLELEKAHPSAYAGACIRRDFAQGATVLFFLDRRQGEWIPAGGPFSRWAEDVSDDNTPWVELTRFYVRIAPLDAERRTALLEAERDALLARADEPAAQAIAADLERELSAPPRPAAVAEAPPPNDGFRRPGDVTSVQRALDAMRADRED